MSMLFLICATLADLLTPINTAPKLGHILFDPLVYEAMNIVKKSEPSRTTNTIMRRFLSTQDKTDEATKKPCSGYDYNDKLCKLLNDRIICGYNKNVGAFNDSESVIDIGNGCHLRGKRVECGYVIGPFTNPRRPPANHPQNNELLRRSQSTVAENWNFPTTYNSVASTKEETTTATSFTVIDKLFMTTILAITTAESTTIKTTSKTLTTRLPPVSSTNTEQNMKYKFGTKCVDTKEHLFCYY